MEFQQQLVHGVLMKRYKRFLADVKLDSDWVGINTGNPNKLAFEA